MTGLRASLRVFWAWLTHDFFKASAVLFLLSIVGSLLNMACRMLLGRMLTRVQIGEMEVMMQVAAYVGIPVSAVQVVVAHEVAKAKGEGDHGRIGAIIWTLSRQMGFYALVAMVLMLATAPFVRDFFRLNSVWPVFATAAVVLCLFMISVVGGGLQGGHRFWQSGLAWLFSPVFRIILSWLLIRPGFGASGALAAHAGAGFLMSAVGLAFVWDLIRTRDRHAVIPLRTLYLSTRPVMVTLLIFAILGGIDIFIVKRFFSPEVAGDYARISVVVRLSLFVTGTLTTALFPWVASEKAGGRRTSHLLNKSLLMGGAIGIGSGLVFLLFTRLILSVFYKDTISPEMIAWTRLLAWALVPMGLIHILIQYLMARASYKFLYGLIPVCLMYSLLLYAVRASIPALIACMGAGSLAIAAGMLYYVHRVHHAGERRQEEIVTA